MFSLDRAFWQDFNEIALYNFFYYSRVAMTTGLDVLNARNKYFEENEYWEAAGVFYSPNLQGIWEILFLYFFAQWVEC